MTLGLTGFESLVMDSPTNLRQIQVAETGETQEDFIDGYPAMPRVNVSALNKTRLRRDGRCHAPHAPDRGRSSRVQDTDRLGVCSAFPGNAKSAQVCDICDSR